MFLPRSWFDLEQFGCFVHTAGVKHALMGGIFDQFVHSQLELFVGWLQYIHYPNATTL